MGRIADLTRPRLASKEGERLVSALGRKLRRISEKSAASGEKQLTRRELERELAERRGGMR
jgi:hypothetical protein